MVRDKISILDMLHQDSDALRRMGVKRLALFGSVLSDQLRADSDLDFLIELQPKTFDAYMNVKEFLESRFGRAVDLVLVSALKPMLRDAICREAVDVSFQ